MITLVIKLLIIGKEKDIVDEKMMKKYLQGKKLTIFLESDLHSAFERFRLINPNVVIIDHHISEQDAIQICKKIKMIAKTPIYYLAANYDLEKMISSFDAGIDDYIVKPFQRSILTAKIIVNSLKMSPQVKYDKFSENKKCLKIDFLEIDFDDYVVKVNGKKVNLIAKELQLLLLLAQNPNKVFSADELYKLVWGVESFGDARTVMVHISNLRKKIEPDSAKPQLIQTVRGFCYKFFLPEDEGSQ